MFRARPAQPSDREPLAAMQHSLWPDADPTELLQEIDERLSTQKSGTMPATLLVAVDDRNEPIGFIDVALRSHADGCNVDQPVGFVEGWYVAEPHRKQGAGRVLMRAAEDWARSYACIEMASDAIISEVISHRAHEALGFEVVDRCVHFRKNL